MKNVEKKKTTSNSVILYPKQILVQHLKTFLDTWPKILFVNFSLTVFHKPRFELVKLLKLNGGRTVLVAKKFLIYVLRKWLVQSMSRKDSLFISPTRKYRKKWTEKSLSKNLSIRFSN